MKSNLLLFLAMLIFNHHSVAFNGGYKTNKLWQLSPEKFFTTSEASQLVDLKHPNHYVLSISIFQATNLLRKKKGLSQLKPRLDLHNAGESHLKQMQKHHFFSHYNHVDASEYDITLRAKKYGGNYAFLGENIAIVPPMVVPNGKYRIQNLQGKIHYFDLTWKPLKVMTYGELGKHLVTEWYHSPGHRANLLNPHFNYVGVASMIVYSSGPDRIPDVYAIQDFGG